MIVLASASPRRADILRSLGLEFRIEAADLDETPLPGEAPDAHARRMAEEKARAVAARSPKDWVLAGDTVVSVDGGVLGKPRDADDAVTMLLRLQGRDHQVVSALALSTPAPGGRVIVDSATTTVAFRPFARETAEAYVETGEPMDKAGAYGIQGRGSALVERIEGDYSGVVGLPISVLVRLMEKAGRPFRFVS